MSLSPENKLPPVSAAVVLFLSIFFLQGCGGAEDDRPQRTAVSGVITFDGEPVEGASITFRPVDESGQTANGRTDEQGVFQMGTFEGTDGVVAGDYTVMISKLESQEVAEVLPEDDPNYDPNPKPQPPPENLLPEKYSKADTSGLTVTVSEGKEISDLKFELSE
ncbi:carboxypeptidase regulatory-like domain-containing protein [Gimesia sp.]|uniref:carboxypeptidase regulatory-like domain-containing protein n=1 Tax=Gimesia sp. TaxID=2024833 RepID=UPI003A920664